MVRSRGPGAGIISRYSQRNRAGGDMRPTQLTIEGFGPYIDPVTIDFNCPSPLAICGAYGSGKTWLAEGVLLSLYGRGGWYPGSIYEHLSVNGTGCGSLKLAFEHDGHSYQVVRVITAHPQRHTAILYQDGQAWVEGKVSAADQAIETLIGPHDLALATWFLSQSRTGDLCGQPGEKDLVARRRGVINQLIGAERLEALGIAYGQEARGLTRQIEELRLLIGDRNPEAELEEARQDLARSPVAALEARSGELQLRVNTAEILEQARQCALEARSLWERWDAQRKLAEKDLSMRQEELQRLNPALSPDEIRIRLSELKVEQDQAQADSLARDALRRQIERLGDQARADKDRLESAPVPLFGEKCHPCPLYRDLAVLQDHIAVREERKWTLEEQLQAIPADGFQKAQELIDLQSLYRDAQRAATLAPAIRS